MKVTFVDAPALVGTRVVERVFGCTYSHYPFPNVFVLSCAAVLRQKGHNVAYVDAAAAGWSRERFIEYVRGDTQSDAHCIYGVNLSKANDLATLRVLRSCFGPEHPVIFLGPGPTWAPEDYLADGACAVVRGEPEHSLAEWIDHLGGSAPSHDVAGVSFLSDGGVVHNVERALVDDLDALPLPARDLLDRDLYFNPKLGGAPFTAMLTSRNCPYQCIYCVPNSLSFARELEHKRWHNGAKPPVRLRSAAGVVQEFEHLHRGGYRAVSIIDDQFLWRAERTRQICDGIRRLDMEWGCLARVDHIHDEVVAAMASAGCQYIDIGIESFNQDTLDFVRKGASVRDAYRAVSTIKRHGISVKVNMLLGASPNESRHSILRNIRIVRELAPSAVMFSIVSPFPGTEFHRMAVEQGWLAQGEYRPVDVQRQSILSYPGVGARELEAIAHRANLTFYLMPGFFWRNLKRVKSLRAVWRGVRSLWRKLSVV